MTQSAPAKFRVIIVGAGPVGLYLTHALLRANINCLVLEKDESVFRHQGAGLVLFPQTIRLLDQIGLYEKAIGHCDIYPNVTDVLARNGQVIRSTSLWSILGERHAYPPTGFSRGQFIALLYENLPEKETRIKTGAAVVDIETHENGVKVHLKDGSVEEGSAVIGIDGAYSKTRRIMQRLAQTPPDTYPMIAAYQGLYGRFRPYAGLQKGTFYQSRGSGIVLQTMAGEETGYFAFLRAIPPTAEPKRYTSEERDRVADELANIAAAPGVSFKDIWDRTFKETAALASQEEGYCDKWYRGRIALAGDAAHKNTSSMGMGVNMGISSAAVLANELYRTLQSEPDPSTEAVENAFARYQETRDSEASEQHIQGRLHVRRLTWETWADWFSDRIVFPWVSVETVAGSVGEVIKRGQILEYVPFEDRKVEVPWVHTPVTR
ncbi:FAD/NAD(P)-binding domain-containing protein [Hypoxylon sp. FL1150]|nr:FAD/NAD(P)-binding domain-containing protein [Hypoxylon sp. FL1150]